MNSCETPEKQPKNKEFLKRMPGDERFRRKHDPVKAIAEMNRKFGRDATGFGSIKTEGNWKMKQLRKSGV